MKEHIRWPSFNEIGGGFFRTAACRGVCVHGVLQDDRKRL